MWKELESKLLSISSETPKSSVKIFADERVIEKLPWDCTALKRKRREKDKHWAIFHNVPNKFNLNLALSKQSEYESKLTSTLTKYEKQITENMKHNPKQCFKYLNSKMKIKSGVSELKNGDGKLLDSPVDNANLLGEFFSSTFIHEIDDLNFELNLLCNEIEELEITNEEVKLLLSEINIYKSGHMCKKGSKFYF